MSVSAVPSMVPLPLTASRAVMSVAFSAPAESVELKSVGSESRSASRYSAVVPLMSVSAVPSMVPLPLTASRTVMSVAFSAPAGVELKSVGSESRSASLSDFSGGADVSQRSAINGAVAVGCLDGGDVVAAATPLRSESKSLGSESYRRWPEQQPQRYRRCQSERCHRWCRCRWLPRWRRCRWRLQHR